MIEAAYRRSPDPIGDRQQQCVWHREAVPDMGFFVLRCGSCSADFIPGPAHSFHGQGVVRPEDIADRLQEYACAGPGSCGADGVPGRCPSCGSEGSAHAAVQAHLLLYASKRRSDLVCAIEITEQKPGRRLAYFIRHDDGSVTPSRGTRAELTPFILESALRAARGEADFSGKGKYPPSLRACLQMDPDFPAALELQAQIRLSEGRLEDAAAGFRRVIQLDDTRRLSWQGLGLCLQEIYRRDPRKNGPKLLQQAGEALLVALELEDTPSVRRAIGGLFAMAGKTAEARAHLEAALVADPDHPATNYNLAVVHLAEDDPKGALPLLDKAIAGLPRDADAVRRRAECLMHLGEYQKAYEELERARRLSPRDPRILRLGKELTEVQRRKHRRST